jgi:hypothetical protein
MTPEMRKKYDAHAQERMEAKEKLFEHLKYNMNQDRPGILMCDNADGSLGCAVG